MSILGSIIGVDVGGIIGAGIPAALEVFSQNNALQIAELNLQAAAAQSSATSAAANSNANNTRFLITGAFILAGAVLAIKTLRGK